MMIFPAPNMVVNDVLHYLYFWYATKSLLLVKYWLLHYVDVSSQIHRQNFFSIQNGDTHLLSCETCTTKHKSVPGVSFIINTTWDV